MESDRVSLDNYLIGASAEWSLAANASQSPEVRKYLVKISQSNNDSESVETAKRILKSDPEVLKAAIPEVLRKQKEDGIWDKSLQSGKN